MAVSMLHMFLVASAVFFNNAVNGQWNQMTMGNGWNQMNGWDSGPSPWGESGGGGGWGGPPSTPDSWSSYSGQSYEPTAATCHVADADGNALEVIIEPAEMNPWDMAWGGFGNQGGVDIHVHIHSATLEGDYTLAVTELSTDYVQCETGDLGYVVGGQPSTPNLGFWGAMSRFGGGQRSRSRGLRDIELKYDDEENVTMEKNRMYMSFEEFRGRGVALCHEVVEHRSGGDKGGWGHGWNMMQQQSMPKYVCEHPVLCCKLGLASAPDDKKSKH